MPAGSDPVTRHFGSRRKTDILTSDTRHRRYFIVRLLSWHGGPQLLVPLTDLWWWKSSRASQPVCPRSPSARAADAEAARAAEDGEGRGFNVGSDRRAVSPDSDALAGSLGAHRQLTPDGNTCTDDNRRAVRVQRGPADQDLYKGLTECRAPEYRVYFVYFLLSDYRQQAMRIKRLDQQIKRGLYCK